MLAPWKKSYYQPRQHIKSRDITLPTKVCLVKAMVFPVVMYGCERKLSTEELMLLSCGVGEDSQESLGLQWDQTSPSYRKSVLNIQWKDWCWRWNSNTLATWCEKLTHLKRPGCWERLKVKGERDNGGWDRWMASPTQWTWVWVNSRSRWWTGRPGVLQSMGSQSQTRLSNWVELNWRRLLRVPWTTRRSSQSILRKATLNIHWKGWCWSWSSSTLATWFEKPTHWKRPWCWKRLRAGGKGGGRGWDVLIDMNLSKFQETVEDRGVWRAAVHGVAKSWTLNNTTTATTREQSQFIHDMLFLYLPKAAVSFFHL